MKKIVKPSGKLTSNVKTETNVWGRAEHQSLQKGQEGGITKYLTLVYGVAVMKWTKSLEDRRQKLLLFPSTSKQQQQQQQTPNVHSTSLDKPI